MKGKRYATVASIVLMLTLAAVPVLGAARSATIKHDTADVSLYGYIDFDNGVLFCQDFYSYILWLSGEKTGMLTMIGDNYLYDDPGSLAYGQFYKEDKFLKIVYLSDNAPKKKGETIKCGTSGSSVDLYMFCGGTTKTLTAVE